MSSNLTPSLPSGNHRSAAAHAVDALSGVSSTAALNARGQTESDSQAFARWMAQYSQAPSSPAMPQAAKPQVAPQANPPAALRESAQKAYRPVPQTQHLNVNVGKPTVPSPPSSAASHEDAAVKPQAQARAGAKALAKPASSKAPDATRHDAKADKGGKADASDSDESADGPSGADTLGQPVAFSTAQGEATAYVKELQPPAHVTAGDPAAMLAWLATLAQANAGLPDKLAPEGSDTSASAAGTAVGMANLGSEPTGRPSQPGWAVQGAMQEHAFGGSSTGKEGEPQGEGEREGALSLEALGMSSTQENSAVKDAASFGAFMSQALTRTPEGLTRQEPNHHTDTLPTPLSSPQFTQALSDKVGLWVTGAAQEGPMTAELRLNPAEMGPVHIRIELDGQTANVDFAAQALETRQAIEASLPMLSEALAQAGLSLSGGGVSDQPQQQAWSQAQNQASGERGAGRARTDGPAGLNPQEPSGPQSSPRIPRGRAGGLDLYA
jgi:flagellar hook-length control protein FliK